jgi:hypothetical protein
LFPLTPPQKLGLLDSTVAVHAIFNALAKLTKGQPDLLWESVGGSSDKYAAVEKALELLTKARNDIAHTQSVKLAVVEKTLSMLFTADIASQILALMAAGFPDIQDGTIMNARKPDFAKLEEVRGLAYSSSILLACFH